MADLYRDYKPFRNFLRQFGLLESLQHVWRYALFTIDKVALPPNYVLGRPRNIAPDTVPFPWELDILAREFVLQAGANGVRHLNHWPDLAQAMTYIRRLDGAAFMLGNNGVPDVMFEIHRSVHRQFPFSDIGIFPKVRAAKVLGTDLINDLAQCELGLSIQQFIWLGMSVTGHFNHTWGLSTNQDYSQIGLPASATKAFFNRLTISMADLRTELQALQRYDQDWAYTWNPLVSKPLIAIDPTYPDRVICPIPYYLINRAFGGVFYDLVNVADFQNPYGASFQAYIGELFARTCPPPTFRIVEVKPYELNGSPAHGVDWIVSDKTGHIFIEAKTKRLTAKAKAAMDATALESDLQVLAEAIAQNYRNILDAIAGHTDWVPDGLPIFPLIATLEDWYIFSPRVKDMLDAKILVQLAKKQIDAKVLVDMPWQLASAKELETATQVIAQVSVYPIMSAKTPAAQGWAFTPALAERFPQAIAKVNHRLFEADFMALMPQAIQDRNRPNSR